LFPIAFGTAQGILVNTVSMATPVINYVFNATDVANPDGTLPITFTNTEVELSGGPGLIYGENYMSAISLGASGTGSVNVGWLGNLDASRFHVHVVFRIDSEFTGSQHIVESDHLPFMLGLVGSPGDVQLFASVRSKTVGWKSTETYSNPSVALSTWHIADMVYDVDTLGIYLDGSILSVHGFGTEGTIEIDDTASNITIGGQQNVIHFNGKLAALKFNSGIPIHLETLLDSRRTSAQWYITSKLESLRPTIDLGQPTGALQFDMAASVWYQVYDYGSIYYHSAASSAFEMHGAIGARYKAFSNAVKASLGYLVTDESVATDKIGRKNLFSNGGIYWSPATGAFEISGQIYIDYENTGESGEWGFPLEAPRVIAGGISQEMQRANWYFKTGSGSAHEAHGAILEEFIATGGVNVWGYPVSNETPLKNVNVGESSRNVRMSQFEGCTIYWSPITGAHEIHGDIRFKYDSLGGPSTDLGLPTTNEMPISGGPGRVNGFEGGAICWYGNFGTMQVIRPFKLFVGKLNTEEDEGAFQGQNDLYINVTINHGNAALFKKKYPDGDWDGRNVLDVNLTFPPVIHPDPFSSVTLQIDVWDSDGGAPFGGGDDFLGTWKKDLNASNAWGLAENGGVLQSGKISKINNITAAVQPVVETTSLTEVQKWWGVTNSGTDPLTYGQYAEAFRDVDSETEWWDLGDDLRSLFYELVAKHIAKGGNCFGMSLEAIYARKQASLFSLPLDRFTSWEIILRDAFNVKQQYQIGAGPIWWFMRQLVSGNTHNPVTVFNETRIAFFRGENPVLCLAEKYDFGGSAHCVLPVGWNSSGIAWTMDILDPNFPGQMRTLFVDSSANRFSYDGGSSARPRTIYSGDRWSGSRLHYMPYGILCTAPRTPIWEAVLLIVEGTVIIMGDDCETQGVQDQRGNDISAHGARASMALQQGRRLDGFVSNSPIYMGIGKFPGELLFSRGHTRASIPFVLTQPIRTPPALLGMGEASPPRSADARASARFDARLPLGSIERDLRLSHVDSIVHHIRGKRSEGTLDYVLKTGCSHVRVSGPLTLYEAIQVHAHSLGTMNAVYAVRTDRAKEITIDLTHRHGVTQDFTSLKMKMKMDAEGELQLGVKPGLQLVDFLSKGTKISEAEIVVISRRNGSSISHTFKLEADMLSTASVRLKINPGLIARQITVASLGKSTGVMAEEIGDITKR
jgi:hypothetical protein